MPFLDRYKNGEYNDVWAELTQMGEDIGDPEVAEDAFAVAREAMQRARRNIELLQERWTKEGWEFGYDWAGAHVADEVKRAPPRLISLEPGRIERWGRVNATSPLPLVLGAVVVDIGPVNFVGCPTAARPGDRYEGPVGAWPGREDADPLQLADVLTDFERFNVDPEQPEQFGLFPDNLLKYFMSGAGGFGVVVPESTFDPYICFEEQPLEIDGVLLTLGNYLRVTILERGGFGMLGDPAFQPDAALLHRLTDGLAPF